MVAGLFWIVAALAAGYAALAFVGWRYADHLLFAPPPPSYPDGPDILRIPAGDGTALAARFRAYPDARYVLVFCHGNAEDLGQAEPRLQELRDRLGVAVVGWDYPGYGRTGGRPDAVATLRGAHAVAAFVAGSLGYPARRQVWYGWSLGGGPAVEAAASQRRAGLVLEGAFTSAFRVVTGVRLLPFDRFENRANLGRVRCPVLVIHGTGDRTIPFSHGRRLLAAAPEPRRHLWVEGAGHTEVAEAGGDAYWGALREFLAVVDAASDSP